MLEERLPLDPKLGRRSRSPDNRASESEYYAIVVAPLPRAQKQQVRSYRERNVKIVQ